MGVPEGEAGPPLSVGVVVAERFRIIDRVGEGGMGEVYVAEQLGMDRRVALKLVRPSLAGDEAMLDRFRREARAASRIKSRNVVTVYDFGRDPASGRLFIAMELLEGETLASRIQRTGAIAIAETLRIAAEVCLALDAAHRAGVIHRDLKPENVFVEHDGNVKVLDFGIARILDPGGGEGPSQATMTATIVGTPAYISPEAGARNKGRPVGPPSDLYSLGVMLFEMLTGRLPFDDDEPMILIGMHLRAPPEHVADVIGGGVVPEVLDTLVDELLAKDPTTRPDGARVVLERLRLATEAIGAAPLPRASLADTTGDQRAIARTPSGTTEPAARADTPAMAGTPKPADMSGGFGTVTRESDKTVQRLVLAGAVAALLLAVVAVAAGFWILGGTAKTPHAAETPRDVQPVPPPSTVTDLAPPVSTIIAPAPPPSTALVPERPALVHIVFDVTPRTARVEVDGSSVSEGALELPGDGASHHAVAIAGGRRSATVEFVADTDRTIRLVVRRHAAAAHHDTTPQGATSTTKRGGLLGLIHDEE